MIQRLYTIRDTVAEENGPVFTAKNDGVALRQYRDILTAIENDPEEYKLYCIGSWDTNDLGSLKSDMYPVLTYPMQVANKESKAAALDSKMEDKKNE